MTKRNRTRNRTTTPRITLVAGLAGFCLVCLAPACADDDRQRADGAAVADAAVADAQPQADSTSGDAAVTQSDGPRPPATWVTVPGPAPAVEGHTLTLLDDGRVLVVGGVEGALAGYTAATWTYDPAADAFSPAGALAQTRAHHTATRLADGRVLVVGGTSALDALATTEIYTPGAPSPWSSGPPLLSGRTRHAAALLADGDVMVAAGSGEGLVNFLQDIALFDPSGPSWSFPALALGEPRSDATATVLASGKVVIAGGINNDGQLASMELYDPATGAVTNLPTLATPRTEHTATLLQDNRVLFVGGWYRENYLAQAANDELYNPVVNAVTAMSHPGAPVRSHAATLLADGRVLVTGGQETEQQTAAVLFDPSHGTWESGPSMAHGRFGHEAIRLEDGSVLVVGGKTGPAGASFVNQAERFIP